MGLAGSHLGFKAGSHVGGSKIPVGIPGGIGGIPPGIPPGTNLGSQAGLAGSRLTFLPGNCEVNGEKKEYSYNMLIRHFLAAKENRMKKTLGVSCYVTHSRLT